MQLIIRDNMVFAVYPDGSQTQATPKQCADEIERLRAALKPFADYAAILEGVNWVPDPCPLSARPDQPEGCVTVGDLRRARDVLGLEQPPSPRDDFSRENDPFEQGARGS